MHIVGITGYVPLARRLLDAGADIACRDVTRRTPLDVATIHGNDEINSYMKYYVVMNNFLLEEQDDDRSELYKDMFG